MQGLWDYIYKKGLKIKKVYIYIYIYIYMYMYIYIYIYVPPVGYLPVLLKRCFSNLQRPFQKQHRCHPCKQSWRLFLNCFL